MRSQASFGGASELPKWGKAQEHAQRLRAKWSKFLISHPWESFIIYYWLASKKVLQGSLRLKTCPVHSCAELYLCPLLFRPCTLHFRPCITEGQRLLLWLAISRKKSLCILKEAFNSTLSIFYFSSSLLPATSEWQPSKSSYTTSWAQSRNTTTSRWGGREQLCIWQVVRWQRANNLIESGPS